MRRPSLHATSLFAVLATVGCGPAPATQFDAGLSPVADAGAVDAGGGGADAGLDAGAGDAGLDAGTADGGMAVASATDAGVISAPADTWAWLDIPESRCGNDAPTGIGVNLHPGATDVFVYLMGGGACWNVLTCAGGTATFITSGYGRGTFEQESAVRTLLFNRTAPGNPLRNAHFVFVPYCTGDVFAGDALKTYSGFGRSITVAHRGRANIDAIARRLGATFPSASRVFVAGSSAGGYGVQLNYPRFAQAFPNAAVHLLADCAQLLQPAGTLLQEWNDAWSLAEPPGCTGCLTNFPAYVDFLTTTYPQRRFALLAYDNDNVLRPFFGFAQNPQGFTNATGELLRTKYEGKANARYYLVSQADHVMLDNPTGVTSQGVVLRDWLEQFVGGGAAWVNVGVLPSPDAGGTTDGGAADGGGDAGPASDAGQPADGGASDGGATDGGSDGG